MLDYSELAAIRLGYGLSPLATGPGDPAALVAAIADAAPRDGAFSLADASQGQLSIRQQRREATPEDYRKFRQDLDRRMRRDAQERIARAVGDAGGFGERLVQFWADHFTVRAGNLAEKMLAAAFVNEAIRPHLNAQFADMMFAAETHPAMLTYLDQSGSIGPRSLAASRRERRVGINENLAREMIELHSLGAGADYTQTDVRQLAKLLTGLGYDPKTDKVFRPVRAEPGAETVLGRSYGGEGRASIDDIRAVIDDLASHEATARNIARKLAVHFVSDNPPDRLVDRLAAAFRETGGDLSAINRALAEAPELAGGLRQKVRQPFEFVVASLRAMGFDEARVMALRDGQVRAQLLRGMAAMGQNFGLPRGPDGWPEDAAAWATPQGLAARIDWAIRELPKLADPPDPRDLMAAAFGSAVPESVQWAVPKSENAREGVALILGSAEFNRR